MITGVSFKRKVRDIVLRKDGQVWPKVAPLLAIVQNNGSWTRAGYEFEILESREHNRGDIDRLIKDNFDGFKRRFWDARVFGNTFLEEGVGDTIRAGVAQFGLAVSVSPVRVHRLTKTKMAPAQGGSDGEEGPTRGMAPLAHRVVEHGVYTMPFFINPTGAQGKRGTGCQPFDIHLLLKLIRYAYPHTKSDIRPLVEVRHAWYAEHEDGLGSFSEFEFIEAMTPRRKGNSDEPSSDNLPLREQYDVPEKPTGLRGSCKNFRDLIEDLPDWCNNANAAGS